MSATVVGICRALSMVKATSSAVKGAPSENVTPGRSVNSQVKSSIRRQDVARFGLR